MVGVRAGRPPARRGVANDELRRRNLGAVLDAVHLADSVSRSELTGATGLNRSTIRDLVGELVELGLVVEGTGTASGAPGRPSSIVSARARGAVAVAVEMEVEYTAVAAIGLGGRVLGQLLEPNPSASATPAEVVDHLDRLVARLLGELPREHRIVGVGIAAAGLVRRHDGVITTSPNRGWSGVSLGSTVAERLGVERVRVMNEANTAALAEFRRGAATEASNLVYVSGAVGVGLGFIQQGSPLGGTLGYAGEAGHMTLNPHGLPCRCGSTGCWETEVGEGALLRRLGLDGGDARSAIDGIVAAGHAGDAETLAALREVGDWLGIGIANVVNVLNPDLILLGGFYDPIFPFLEPWIVESGERFALAAPWQACEVARGALGANARLIGAAELIFRDLVADPSALAAGSLT